jgi:N-methylhydantoinase B
VRVELGPIEGCTMHLFYTADGMINPAQGARGGLPGGRIEAWKRERSGELVAQPNCVGVELMPGESVVSVSSGGGGYGPPTERDPARVVHDVAEGWISRARAAEVYGVVLDADGTIDQAATGRRRAALVAT